MEALFPVNFTMILNANKFKVLKKNACTHFRGYKTNEEKMLGMLNRANNKKVVHFVTKQSKIQTNYFQNIYFGFFVSFVGYSLFIT